MYLSAKCIISGHVMTAFSILADYFAKVGIIIYFSKTIALNCSDNAIFCVKQ